MTKTFGVAGSHALVGDCACASSPVINQSILPVVSAHHQHQHTSNDAACQSFQFVAFVSHFARPRHFECGDGWRPCVDWLRAPVSQCQFQLPVPPAIEQNLQIAPQYMGGRPPAAQSETNQPGEPNGRPGSGCRALTAGCVVRRFHRPHSCRRRHCCSRPADCSHPSSGSTSSSTGGCTTTHSHSHTHIGGGRTDAGGGPTFVNIVVIVQDEVHYWKE